jgi:DNA adenine methylase
LILNGSVTAVLSTKTGLHPRPFLKWAGGKGRLLGQYEPFLPTTIDTYYEPFLGGGAVFFHLAGRMQRAVLGDINPELVNVYCCVRDQVESLLSHLWDHQRRHNVDYYYEVRQRHALRSPLERAARLIYLNKTCYNGLYRENSQGQFNVPVGKYKKPNICDPSLLRATSAALQKAEIRTFSFETLLSRSLSSQDFVYFDPPYHPISSTSSFTSYSRYGFSRDDQQTLAHVFSTLAARGQRVMLSNSDCEFIRDLYQEFDLQPILAARAINSRAGQRGKIGEVLVTAP